MSNMEEVMPNVIDQSEELLLKIYQINKSPGKFVKQSDIYDYLKVKVSDQAKIMEINYLLDDVLSNSFKYLEQGKSKYKITPDGFKFLHEAFYRKKDSNIAFCAMWFNEKTNQLWSDGIEPAVKAAGYEPRRIDKEHFTEDIIAQMFILINKSKFVIADLTGNRGGVYFEAGYAKARGLHVIFTCCAKEWENSKPHFDVEHFPFITWDNLEKFKQDLQSRIINILS